MALLLLGGTAAWLLRSGGGGAEPDEVARVARGKALYAENCASCHGVDLEGQPDWRSRKPDGRMPAPPHDATGHTFHHPRQVLFGIVKEGIEKHAPPGYQSDMPAFGAHLGDEDIWAVLTYIASRWPDKVRDRWMSMSRSTEK